MDSSYYGIYSFDICGAQGGNHYGVATGGNGARIKGSINLTAGTVLCILVGQQGQDNCASANVSNGGAGGGGGSFVWFDSDKTLIGAAGGGGGGSLQNDGHPRIDGDIGQITTNGSASKSGQPGGTNGGNGSGSIPGYGWNTLKNTLIPIVNGQGGFGGGGGVVITSNQNHGGAGGGGYSGGGGHTGGGNGCSYGDGGGGAGSFASPQLTGVTKTAGYKAVHGSVIISFSLPTFTYANDIVSNLLFLPLETAFNIEGTLSCDFTSFKYKVVNSTTGLAIKNDNAIVTGIIDMGVNVDVSILPNGFNVIKIIGLSEDGTYESIMYSYIIFKTSEGYVFVEKTVTIKPIVVEESVTGVFVTSIHSNKILYAVSCNNGMDWSLANDSEIASILNTKNVKLVFLMLTASELKSYSILFIPEVN